MTKTYESLPKIAKLILQFFFGYIIGGVYRIIRFTEKGNIVTLIAGILFLVTAVGNVVAWVIDFVTELTSDKITFLAD